VSEPRDAGNWAGPVEHLSVTDGPGDGDAVQGRRLSGPIQGFGRMWQKTYRVPLPGSELTPAEVITVWKEHFGSFWPSGGRFTAPLAGLAPGEVGLISARTAGITLSTGVFVLYVDDVSFTFLTPEGHPFAGMVTFSAATDPQGVTCAQVQLLIRAHDPLIELGMIFGGHRKEDRHWKHTLESLARHLGVEAEASREVVCVDRRRQWNRIGNVRHDAALRATTMPFRGKSG
jgi:hypothetical protein